MSPERAHALAFKSDHIKIIGQSDKYNGNWVIHYEEGSYMKEILEVLTEYEDIYDALWWVWRLKELENE